MKITDVPKAGHIPAGKKRMWREMYCFNVNKLGLKPRQARAWANCAVRIALELA